MHVSVVIPAKNEENTIGQCLDRLVPQLKPGDEVLVLDNGSTDRTAPVAEVFDHVEVVYAPDDAVEDTHHYRGNLDGIRQMGAEMASNEIIVSTDADTLPQEGWLDRIRQHFEDDPDLDLVWGKVMDTNGVPVRNLTGKYLTLIGGVSGCNTAVRKAAFEKLEKGYVGWPMFEDVALITRLARVGKVRHDRGLWMVADLDRTRYQTYPMLAAGALTGVGGALAGGPIGAVAAGTGLGLASTESFYEEMPDSRFHHDQIGMGMVVGGLLVGGTLGWGAVGVGSGIVAHHLLTEGTSAIPTKLMQNTDQVCRIPETDAEVMIDCEPPDDGTMRITRIAGGLALGAIAGKLIQVA